MNILKDLNPSQKIAATTFYGPMLILAGAGSGKTKTLITRTANMILNKIDPSSILVMTFTNKAAKEMKERGEALLNKLDLSSKSPNFSTFHSFCLKFLKNNVSYSKEIFPQFTIIDENISKSIINLVVKDLYKREMTVKDFSFLLNELDNRKIPFASEELIYNELNKMIITSTKPKKDLKWLSSSKINIKDDNSIKKLSKAYSLYKKLIDEHSIDVSIQITLTEVYGKENKDITEDHLSSIFTILQNNLISYKEEDKTYEDILDLIMLFNKNRKSLQWMTSNFVNPSSELDIRLLAKAFISYKEILRKNNTVDFDDLINLSIQILRENKSIQKFMKEKYNFIMVDEFQDTNLAQIVFLELITNDDNNICVVGDDSQSIYAWRGADISYILNFHKRFVNTTVINLTENYRSTPNIVSRANKLLESAEEKHSLKESLRAFRKDDGEILCSQLFNDRAEGDFVAKEIRKALNKGVNPNEIAILYRNNFIVESIEKALIKAHIPYQIFKGRSILQKKASVEFMSFINFLVNKNNYFILEEFLSSTTKLISEINLEKIRFFLNLKKINIIDFLYSDELIKEAEISISKDKLSEIRNLFKNIDLLREKIENKADMMDISNIIRDNCLLFDEYKRILESSTSDSTVKNAESSLNNLYLMLNLLTEYETIELFLEDVTLSSETASQDEGKVNLMTVHASKGLEFEYVFVVRFNNEIFPSKRSMMEPSLLEEERRLAYVALTRAKVYLSVSYILKGFNGDMAPSRFLRESDIFKFNKVIYNEPQKKNNWY